MGNVRTYRNLLVVILFATALAVPVLLQVGGFHIMEITTENRGKNEFPGFKSTGVASVSKDFKNFTKAYNQYYRDNFALRGLLIRTYCKIKLDLLKTNPFPDRVVMGREGWMFLGEYSSNSITETKGLVNFTKNQIETISRNYSDCKQFFTDAGIKFYIAAAPEKGSVYGDYLPVRKSKRPTKLDQVKLALKNLGGEVIDLKEDFKQHPSPLLFYKTDSHWNEFGEFYAYQTLMKRLKTDFNDLEILGMDDFTIDTIRNYQGDNARVNLLPGTDNQYNFSLYRGSKPQPLDKVYQVPETYHWNPSTYERRFATEGKKLKILVFHDSFFREFQKFLAPGFRETVFIWAGWNKEMIQKEKPDIVVYETAERNLEQLLYPLK